MTDPEATDPGTETDDDTLLVETDEDRTDEVDNTDEPADESSPRSRPPLPPRWPYRWQRTTRMRARLRYRTRRRMNDARATRASVALSALSAALLLAGGWFVFVGPPPGNSAAADLVSDYLETLRDGDAEAALRIAGVKERPERDEFLTDAALDGDWRVESLTEVTADGSDERATVRVTIVDDSGLRSRGEFAVSGSATSPRIDNPFVRLGVASNNPPGFLDLNGVVASLPKPAAGDTPTSLSAFPGGYRLYAKHRSLAPAEPGRVLLLPTGSDSGEGEAPTHSLTFRLTVTAKAQTAAQRAVTALVERCVESDELAPADCPFTAADELRNGVLETDDQYFSDVTDLKWRAAKQPKVRLLASPDGELWLTQRNDAVLTLTGTGKPVFGDDEKPRKFTVECPFDLDELAVSLTGSGGFALKSRAPERRNSNCQLR